jgi:hypothetical protein
MPRSSKSPCAVEATSGQTAPDQGKPLSDAQEERYSAAISALKRSPLGSDPKGFGSALDVAIYHCEKARAFDWPEGKARKRVRKAAGSWNSANSAAHKLAVHFENLDELTGSKRLAAALTKAGMQMRAAQTKESLYLAFARFLRALARQVPRRAGGGYQIGPLGVGKSSQKLPGREVVLTLVLAHLFDRVASNDSDGTLELFLGELISSGSAWDVAADFASAALGEPSVDPNAAKKFLHDHRGHLSYYGWPKSDTA